MRQVRLLVAMAGLIGMTWSMSARAESASCTESYEHAQVDRTEGRLRAARAALEACIQPSCPGFVRDDCARWLSEVESALPSLVLVAMSDGHEVDDVEVFFDDTLLVSRLDGRAVLVDPGPHVLKFVRAGAEPVIIELRIRDGEKNRIVTAAFAAPPSEPVKRVAPARSAKHPERARPSILPYALAGVGALGVTGFAVFGLMGNSEAAERRRTCAPNCTDDEVGSVRTKYLLADVSLGVGVAALGAAAFLYFTSTRDTSPPRPVETAMNIDVHLTSRGGALRVKFP